MSAEPAPVVITEALVIRPGDHVLMRLDPRTTADVAQRLQALMSDRLRGSGVEVTLVAVEEFAVVRAPQNGDSA